MRPAVDGVSLRRFVNFNLVLIPDVRQGIEIGGGKIGGASPDIEIR